MEQDPVAPPPSPRRRPPRPTARVQKMLEDVTAGMQRLDLLAKYADLCATKPAVIEHALVLRARAQAITANTGKSIALRPWQQQVVDTIFLTEPEATKVVWVVDSLGGAGKTWFAKYILHTYQHVQILRHETDHVHIDTDIAVFDLPHHHPEPIRCDALECAKDGADIGMPRHVVVLSTQSPPDTTSSIGFTQGRVLIIRAE